MATVQEALRAVLSADAGVQAVLGNPPRISANMARQGVAQPYATYAVVANDHEQHLDGHGQLAWYVLQFDCWDSTYLDAHAAMEAIRSALQDATGTYAGVQLLHVTAYSGLRDETGSLPDGRESKIHRVSRDYKVWFYEQ